MALVVFTVTLIIAMTLNTVTMDRCLAAANRRSITSTPTKREMGEAMSAQLVMTAGLSMLSPAEEAGAAVAASWPRPYRTKKRKGATAPFLFSRAVSVT
jgi:hypothetical protein